MKIYDIGEHQIPSSVYAKVMNFVTESTDDTYVLSEQC